MPNPFLSMSGDDAKSFIIPFRKNGNIIEIAKISLVMSQFTEYSSQLNTNSDLFISRENNFIMAARAGEHVRDSRLLPMKLEI